MVKSQTTPYHAQSDGHVERFNCILLDMLAKAVQERPFQWEDHLCRLCLAYNTSVKLMTGYNPFCLMFGHKVQMPVHLIHGSPNFHGTTVPRYVADLCSNPTSAYTEIRDSYVQQIVLPEGGV